MDSYARFFKIIPKLTEIYTTGFELFSIYNSIYSKAFQQASMMNCGEELELEAVGNNNNTFYDRWRVLSDKQLDKELKSDSFTSLLSRYMDSLVELHSTLRQIGYPVYFSRWLFNSYVKNLLAVASVQKNDFDRLTPFDVMFAKGKARLLHYYNSDSGKDITTKRHQASPMSSSLPQSPVLLLYAPINRFHIMDICPDRSVVRALLSRGLDVYLLDWGYPEWNDSCLSLSDYVNYVKDSVQIIKDKTGTDKISMLGYCWGGIIGIIYAALNNENLKSLALMGVPIDFSKDNTILTSWAKAIDVDKMIDEFDHIDGLPIDLAFIMRNPPRYAFDRYIKLFERLHDKQFVNTFIALQKWLSDTPPIPGNLYRQIINDCYKNNLLISNRMRIDGKVVDLRKITIPLLTIVAKHDDLVSPESTLSVNHCVSSREKITRVYSGDHIGLCVSSIAHKKLWPEVSEWIISKSAVAITYNTDQEN